MDFSKKVFCPECEEEVIMEEGHEVGCEDCGSHSAVRCPNCGEFFDHVWGYNKIREFNLKKGIEIGD
jgi:DNA-directed RNA polymerase subunit RPC12/RpoP